MREMTARSWFVGLVAAIGLSLAATGCGSDTNTPTATPKKDAAADAADPDTKSTDTGDVVADTTEVPDTVVPDAVVKTDASDVVQTSCSDDYCAKQLASTLKLCEEAKCDTGSNTCKAQPKGGFCCDDVVCDDNNPSTIDKCNPDTAKCEYKAKAGACESHLFMLQTFFEQGQLEGFQTTDGATNGNVKWHVDNKRSHSGKSALYFGNECYSYDASMTASTSCTGGGTGGAIATTLKAPSVTLPKGKQSMLHFWLWLAAEPTYLDAGSTKGTCSGCGTDFSCIINDNISVCAPEKDILKVKVNGEEVWNSMSIGKSTKGQWAHVALDLAKFTGNAATLTWEFKTNSGLKNNFEGIYLDDVIVETVCDEPGNSILCDNTTNCKADDSACTADGCTKFANNASGSGICFFDQTPGCCVGVIDCDDMNDCTKDSCTKASGAEQGVCKNVPNADNAQCCQASNYLSEGFENGLSTWTTAASNSQVVTWQKNPNGGVNGTASLYFGGANFANYDDPAVLPKGKGPAGIICSKTITLKTGTIYNLAQFQLNLATEWDGKDKAAFKNPPDLPPGTPAGVVSQKVDELKLLLKIAGQYCGASECKAPGTELPDGIWTSDMVQGTTDGKWLPVAVKLDKYAGKDVQVCFSFDAGDGIANQFKGAAIDDVKVDVACKEATCLYDAMCAAGCNSCQTAQCLPDGSCACNQKPDCCVTSADCDDVDTCTNDTCTGGTCVHALKSPTCCSNKTAFSVDLSKTNGTLPTGWKAATLSGVPPYGAGATYSKGAAWSVTTAKSPTGSGYSFNFGINGATYNTGNEVPAGLLRSGDIAIPANGTGILTFQLFLSTEWDASDKTPNAVFGSTGVYTDRMRVGLYDPNEKDPAKNTVWFWSSFDIDGTTHNKFRQVVAAIPPAWMGKTARLQFEFDAGTTANNNFAGPFVADLGLAVVCDKPACLADADCVPSGTPDICKTYLCTKDANALLFSCSNTFKPGPTCCQPGQPLETEPFEGGDLSKSPWVPGDPSGPVNWQVIPHKYLGGKFELYFGNAQASPLNYANGTSAVQGVLDLGKSVTLSSDLNKGAYLDFKAYLDIEKTLPEHLQVRITVPGTGITNEVIWDHTNPKDFNPATEMKVVVEKKVDLSAYKGKGALNIEFYFDSGDGLKNDQYQGIFLDEISIQEPCL